MKAQSKNSISTTQNNSSKTSSAKRTAKRRKKKSGRGLKWLWIALIFVISACACGGAYWWWSNHHSNETKDTPGNTTDGTLESYNEPKLQYDSIVEDHTHFGRGKKIYSELLHDINDVHLESATTYGILPCEDSLAVIKAWQDRKLIKVVDGDRFDTEACTFPYLVPEAYDILLKISDLYRQKMGAKKRLRVTSCMRSEAFVRKLTGQDPDKSERIKIASKRSAHRFGTTFDISYAMMSDAEKEALAQVLKSLRDAGYLNVLFEYSQPCFHSTIAKPGHK